MEGSLEQQLFLTELEFSKILVPGISQNTSNVNIECARNSKQLYSLCDQVFGAPIYRHFIVLMLVFLIDYAWFELCNIWLLLFNNNSRSITTKELSTGRKPLVQLLLKTGS